MAASVTGRVTFRRRLSARLVFYDVSFDEGSAVHTVELALKAGADLDDERVKSLRDTIKLGDVVSASGEFDPTRRTLTVQRLHFVERWQEANPGQHFRPELVLRAQAERKAHNRSTGAQPAPPSGVCKFWLNTGTCLKGEACPHAHSAHETRSQDRSQWISARRKNRRQAAAEAGDPHGATAAHKSHRAGVFCDWLIDAYGADFLSQGSGVLDVAGGRGEVAFILHTVKGIPTTLIDPRPQKLSKKQHAQLQALAAGDPAQGRPSVYVTRQDGVVMARRSLEDGRLFPGLLPDQILMEFGPDLWHGSTHGPMLQQCSLVIGLHPDQATDAISDFASAFGKPQAIVPCCVFPRLFPHRMLPQPLAAAAAHQDLGRDATGQGDADHAFATGSADLSEELSDGSSDRAGEAVRVPVVLHQQLVEYLRLRAGPSAQTAYLKFEGMNQVVFSLI